MFRGQYFHSMDEKGRLSIPARFREVLGGLQDERLVLAPFEDRGYVGLEAFPHAAWRDLEEKLKGNHPFDAASLDVIYARVGLSVDCQPDAQGRILVSPEARQAGGLRREVAFSGHIDTFRIWDAETWRQVVANARKVYADPKQLTQVRT
jgi:MraZ protein